MNPQPKIKPKRNQGYLDFIRDHPCIICDNPETEAHHVRRLVWGAGAGIKPHDYCSLPLCANCHNPATEALINCEELIIYFNCKYAIEKYGEMDLIDGLIEYLESKRRKNV